mmetsp:Transcript_97169/g.299494  ORF Transcript_97169/g.299494 Transcript_97169/m.299494 type:complete len:214 (-) Transcript_97169:1288-1929(-)
MHSQAGRRRGQSADSTPAGTPVLAGNIGGNVKVPEGPPKPLLQAVRLRPEALPATTLLLPALQAEGGIRKELENDIPHEQVAHRSFALKDLRHYVVQRLPKCLKHLGHQCCRRRGEAAPTVVLGRETVHPAAAGGLFHAQRVEKGHEELGEEGGLCCERRLAHVEQPQAILPQEQVVQPAVRQSTSPYPGLRRFSLQRGRAMQQLPPRVEVRV